MTHPLYSDINLTGIKSQLIEELDNETNIPIPETFPIATNLLKDFNNRCFNSTNINDILSLCDYLMIDNTETFVKYNMEPDTKEYILLEYHMIHYNIPKQTFEEMTIENMVCYKLKKYIVKFSKFYIGNKYICLLAGKYGHLDILIWARSINYDWDENTCIEAVSHGHLNILQYARENSCPWTVNTLLAGIEHNHVECVSFAILNGCPYINQYIKYDFLEEYQEETYEYVKIVRYVCAHGLVDSLKILID